LAAQPAPNPNAPIKAGQPNAAQLAAEQLLQHDRVTVDGVRLLFFGLGTASWTGLHSLYHGKLQEHHLQAIAETGIR
jgi:hypothetical protein